jgi:hypothetical protein
MGALVIMLAQLFQVTTETTNRLAVMGDASLAAQTLARDVNSATVAVVSGPHNLTLTQPDPDGGGTRTISYSISPPLLVRDDGSGAQTVARNVSSDTAFSPTGVVTGTGLLTVRFVSVIGEDSTTTTIQLGLRPQP